MTQLLNITEVELEALVHEGSPKCTLRLQVTNNVADWQSWPPCPRNAVWAAIAHCPTGHVNTDLTCDEHRKWIEDGFVMFRCNACGFTAPHAPTEWRRL